MSKFAELRNNPPKLEVKENAREVIFEMVSVMCDNRSRIIFRKNNDGDFRAQAIINQNMGYAFSNYQMKHHKLDIEWAADEGHWLEVIRMLNSGTALIESVKSR